MRKWFRKQSMILIAWTILACCVSSQAARKEKVREEVAIIDTNLGLITFRFFSQESPKTVEAFKKLVRAGFFDSTVIHKVLPGLLIQGGDPQTRDETGETHDVKAETLEIEKSDLKHHVGTVSMAHAREDLKSRSEFFICLQEVSYFDGKHTIIGEVISGLKIVQAISNVPRNLRQTPLFPVRVKKIRLETQDFYKEVR